MVLELCREIIENGESVENSGGNKIGYCLRNQEVGLVIEVLESLQFSFHNPDPKKGRNMNLKNYMRELDTTRGTSTGFNQLQDPYLIAAYLKFWKSAMEEGLDCQGNDGMSWNPVEVPKFNIAIRFGSLDSDSSFDFPLMNREISNEGNLTSSWGSRGYGTSHIDEWFDAKPPHDNLPAFRPIETPGLVLIHVISKDATGRNDTGSKYQYDRPTVALNIPQGGPAILSDVAGD